MRRRDFLLLTGAAGVAVALDPYLSHIAANGDAVPEVMPGIESFLPTTCLMCPGGCGIRVRRVDGIPKGISGNPNHPLNAGGVCTEGISALQLLYHPDRLMSPMRRKGARGSGEFEPVGWDDALKAVSEAMKDLENKRAQEKLAFILGRSGGSMETLVRHFMGTWGSPYVLSDRPRDGFAQVFQAMHGIHAQPAFDFDGSDFVLSFGADLLNAWESPLQFQQRLASFRAQERSVKGTLCVADIRLSHTASLAQECVGLAPGSHGALALGIAYVMIRESRYDAAFADQFLYGFQDVAGRSGGGTRQGYRSLVLRDYSPEVVSRLTGVPVERIINLGKAFGESAAALALLDENVVAQPGGLYAGMAVHSLNLLKGNINRPGGIYLQPEVPLSRLGAETATGTAGDGIRTVEDLATMASSGGVDLAFLYYSNPLSSSSFSGELREALKKIGMIVSFSPFLDETSRYADFVLPDALPLERWEDKLFPSSFPMAGWGVVQPCIKEAGVVRHTGDVLLQLAQIMGGKLSQSTPWKTFEEILKHRARGLYETQAGSPITNPFDQELLGQIQSRGWWLGARKTFDEFWQQLLDAGAWVDPNYRVRSIHDYSGNPDGKIDLYSRDLERRIARTDPKASEIECLPHHHSESEPNLGTEYPMTLNPYRPGRLSGGTSGMLPWTRLAVLPDDSLAGDPWAEINPGDGKSQSIVHKDWIWIESSVGKIKVRAVFFQGAAPGVVNVPYGLGGVAESGEEGAGDPLKLVAPKRDPLTGLVHKFGTKVKIYKA